MLNVIKAEVSSFAWDADDPDDGQKIDYGIRWFQSENELRAYQRKYSSWDHDLIVTPILVCPAPEGVIFGEEPDRYNGR